MTESDLTRAIEILLTNGYTCVACRGADVFSSREKGVKPLLGWLDSGINLTGFSAADTVVGHAAAFLYITLGVSALYCGVLSRGALELLERRGITVRYGTLTKEIINRAGTGPCPFEEAVREDTTPEAAVESIRAKARILFHA